MHVDSHGQSRCTDRPYLPSFTPCFTCAAMFEFVRCPARNDEDLFSWWVTGKATSFFFFMAYKNTLFGEIKLKKIAGEFKPSWDRKAAHCSVAVFLAQVYTI